MKWIPDTYEVARRGLTYGVAPPQAALRRSPDEGPTAKECEGCQYGAPAHHLGGWGIYHAFIFYHMVSTNRNGDGG